MIVQITKVTIDIDKEGIKEDAKELTLEDCGSWVEDCYGNRVYKDSFGRSTSFSPRPFERIHCYTFCYAADVEKSKQAVKIKAKKVFKEMEDKYQAMQNIMSKIV